MATQASQGPTDTPASDIAKLTSWVKELEREKKGKIEILVTGKTGVGKSTLVNALVGRKVAKEGHNLKPTTMEVTRYSMKTGGEVEIIVWDSPGLQDGTENEEKYLADMKKKCSDVDLILYCIDSSEKRSELGPGQRDSSAIHKFTAMFGNKWWNDAMFVLTSSNVLESMLSFRNEGKDMKQAFQESIQSWKDEIKSTMESAKVAPEVMAKIPVVPAGHVNKPDLPGCERWLSQLWIAASSRIKKSAKLNFFRANQHRFQYNSEVTAEDFKRDGHLQPLIVDGAVMATSSFLIPVGELAGAGIGAAIGAIVGGVAIPGLGASPGAVTGAAIGAEIGVLVGGVGSLTAFTGAALHMLMKIWKLCQKYFD